MTDVAFYTRVIASAERIIEKYGRPFTLRHLVDNDPVDPDKPWDASDPTPTDVPLIGAFTEYDRSLIDNTTILRTDKKLIFVDPGGLVTWEVSDKDIVIDSLPVMTPDNYIVCNPKITAPGPVKVVYELQLRKG